MLASAVKKYASKLHTSSMSSQHLDTVLPMRQGNPRKVAQGMQNMPRRYPVAFHITWRQQRRTTHVFMLQENAVKVAKRMQNRPRHPAELAADVVERVLLTQGDSYLVTPEHRFKWWQLSVLDVKAFLLLIVGLIGLLLWVFVRWAAPICLRAGKRIIEGSNDSKRKAA